MKISASVISHPGKSREKNEDNFYFDGLILDVNLMNKPYKFKGGTNELVLMGIFDGMGGISDGERASHLAAEITREASVSTNKSEDIATFLKDICKEANKRVCNEMLNVLKKRIGTTASMLCFSEGKYYLCNVGDSPIFIMRKSRLTEISHEHTEKENYLRLYGEESIPPKKKFKLTQNIGIFPEEMEIEPYVISDELREGDSFLICSDGLTDMVEQDEIAEIMNSKKSAAKKTTALLERALAYGGKDNITIICIDVKRKFSFT